MKRPPLDGRRFAPTERARAVTRDDGRVALFAPGPGRFRPAVVAGSLLRGGDRLGDLEVLGRARQLRVPDGVAGQVVEGERGPRPVDHHTALVVLDPEALAAGTGLAPAPDERDAGTVGPVFRTPLGGRYYAQPSPDAPPFVTPGQVLKGGDTVALIEVMKTFNRVRFGGDDVPARARVLRVVPTDGDDLEEGDVLFELAPE